MTLIEPKDYKSILKKHVNTIHCSNNLTLVQRKLFNALLFNAYHEMPEKLQYEISIKKLCHLIGYDSRDYKKLRKAIVDLLTTAIEWNVIENVQGEQTEKWRASSIVSATRIEKGLCTYEFSSVMRELLYRPEIYGKIDIQIMTQFKSSYGLALYENCIRFQSVASTPWLTLQTFKKLMGISEDHYPHFCDLKKRVLDIAVKEVNLYSPITVTPEIQRVNKKVVSIKFKLAQKKDFEENGEPIDPIDAHLLEELKRDFRLSEKVVLDVLTQYELDYIKDKIQLIKKSDSFQSGKIRDLAAYLVDSLKRDYKSGNSSTAMLNEANRQRESQAKIQSAKEEKIQKELKKQKVEKINGYINHLTEEERSVTYKAFEQTLIDSKNTYLIKSYKRYGLNSKSIQALFYSYVLDIIEKIEFII